MLHGCFCLLLKSKKDSRNSCRLPQRWIASSSCSNSAYLAQVQRHRDMGSGEGKPHWSVYDVVKIIAATPEALMAEIDSAISNLEHGRATAILDSAISNLDSSPVPINSCDASFTLQYDARMADEAYKAGRAALAAGKLDEALHSLNISLSKRPPDKTSAVAKLQSLIPLASQQLQKSAN